ncbi:hypothetical protein DSO57_1015280 [Entomophthora muscae]|uniref:Uncharacterized protein n=1 Tax=Entomophthora muscae TaxID=34485 RepID=A0ACC2U2Z5_9FUNG|nr:hypothetical protein DSO57_1015280 [Entomophthora muscae]
MDPNTGPELLHAALCSLLTTYWDSIDEVGYLPHLPLNSLESENAARSNPTFPFILADGNSKLGIPLPILPQMFLSLKQILMIPSENKHSPCQIELLSRCMLIVNPGWYPNYSIRKKMVVAGQIDLKAELRVLDIIFFLPTTTKNSSAWFHRKWISKAIYESPECCLHPCDLVTHFNDEIQFAFKLANRASRNYYAWEFIYWNICQVICLQPGNSSQTIQSQFKETLGFIKQHISDSGAYHHLSMLIRLDMAHNSYLGHPPHYLGQGLSEIHRILETYPGPRQSAVNGLSNIVLFLMTKLDKYMWVSEIVQSEHRWAAKQLCVVDPDIDNSEFARLIQTFIINLQMK